MNEPPTPTVGPSVRNKDEQKLNPGRTYGFIGSGSLPALGEGGGGLQTVRGLRGPRRGCSLGLHWPPGLPLPSSSLPSFLSITATWQLASQVWNGPGEPPASQGLWTRSEEGRRS